jgi:hypothetical protein
MEVAMKLLQHDRRAKEERRQRENQALHHLANQDQVPGNFVNFSEYRAKLMLNKLNIQELTFFGFDEVCLNDFAAFARVIFVRSVQCVLTSFQAPEVFSCPADTLDA